MTTALVLLVIVLVNNYFPKVPFVTGFLKSKGTLWVKMYLEFMLSLLQKASWLRGEVVSVLVILPIIIITLLLNYLSLLLLKEWGHVLFMLVTIYYCLSSDLEDEHESILVLAHERIFGIVFWFSIFGATGAMFYWSLIISRTISDKIVAPMANFQRGLNIMHGLAAWLPARATGFIYALVGDFVQGFDCLHECMKSATLPSSKVLLDCGEASLHAISDEEEEALVQRALIAWVTLGMLIAVILGVILR